MGSNHDRTEAALAAVLSLCNCSVGQEDMEAVQRHDEAAIALLDVNEDASLKALKLWIKSLEAWAQPRSTKTGEGPWSIMTQPCTAVLSKANQDNTDFPAKNRPPSTGAPLAAHKALTVILYRLMLLGDEVQGSSYRSPTPAAWAAGRAYLIMLSIPGAGAYGILQPAVLSIVLTNLRSWCRNSAVYRPGGVSAVEVPEDGAERSGKNKGPRKRRRETELVAAGSDSESDGESHEESAGKGRRKGRKRAGARVPARGGVEVVATEVRAYMRLLNACLSCVPLASHQDLAVKLSEVIVGVSVIAAVEGSAVLGELASATMVGLVTSAPDHDETTHGAVLQALMPVILMATARPDVPPRNKDCLKAHDHAVNIAKAIASALRNVAKERNAVQGSLLIISNHTERQGRAESSTPIVGNNPPEGGGNTSPLPGDEPSVSPTNGEPGEANGSLRVPQVVPRQDEDRRRLNRPVLTMVQHLCVSAPERAEGRARLAGGIAALLSEMEGSDRERFVSFLAKLSRSSRILHRGFAVEVSSRLLTEAWPWVVKSRTDHSNKEANDATDGQSPISNPVVVSSSNETRLAGVSSPSLQDGGGKTVLNLVVARAVDRAPTVRSKAASTLAEVLSGIRSGQSGFTGEPLRQAVMEACGWGGADDFRSHGAPLLDVVRSRVQDEKANVRRNAVPALGALLALSPAIGETASGRDPSVQHANDFLLLEERCNDVSLATRKAAMTALSSLLMARPADGYLQSAWVRALLPLASDPEQTCQTRLVELVRTVVLDRVVAWHRAEILAKKANKKGTAGISISSSSSSSRPNSRAARETTAAETSQQQAEAEEGSPCNGDGVSSVWQLLAKAGDGDAHKCLKKVISTLMSQKDSGFKAAPVLNALRSAAVMALPPKANTAVHGAAGDTAGGDEEEGCINIDDKKGDEDEGDWDVKDLRLLSLAKHLPTAFLTTIRRGTWALLEAFLDPAPSPENGGNKSTTKGAPELDPMFVVRCWNRIRGHIVKEALAEKGASTESDNSEGLSSSSSSSSPSPSPSPSPVSGEAFESDGRRVLGVLARLAWSVPAEVASPLAEDLLEMLLALVARPETSAALVGALHMLCFAKVDSEEKGAAMCNAWANHALSSFEELLDMFVYQGSGALQDHPGARACGFDMARLVERLLFAVGEVVVVGFTGKEDAAGPSDPQAPGASAVGSVTVRPKPSPLLVRLVQVLLPPRLPSTAHGVEEGEEGPATPSAVRALAFVTLGKLCLRDKPLAKTSVNILVRELDTADDPAVRSNALVVLGDLCVRYTAMVDRHVGAMAACLQDRHPLVKRHAILLISQLLLQDYVKWRGLLVYRFLATLVDSDQSVRNLGSFTLTRPLITKTPGLFAQNFVEAMFVLNNYSEHPCYAAAAAGRADAGGGVTMEGIDLEGDSSGQIRKRMSVYSTMLEHMSDEQKITVTAKIAQEVLSAAIEGGLPIATGNNSSASSPDPSGIDSAAFLDGKSRKGREGRELKARRKASAVVKDALTVMASPGIRVGGKGGAAAGDIDDGSEDMASQQSGPGGLAAAKSSLLSKVALKHLMEAVVPILTALKHVLERAQSPLLRELMFYFGELFRSHKEDVKAVLASEAGLVEEIDFDLRRFEKDEGEKKKRAKEAAAIAAEAAITAVAAASTSAPKTPRGRRSMASGGGCASGRRRSSAGPGMRGPRTPMAKALHSARKTPFQNLGDCSAIKLKGAPAAVFGPTWGKSGVDGQGGGVRRSRPKTPLQLRTPREAVAAALGNPLSPMSISPLPMKDMESSVPSGTATDSISSTTTNNNNSTSKNNLASTSGRADIELASPVNPHPAKKRRWPVSVPPPPADTDDGPDGTEEFDGGNGVFPNGKSSATLGSKGEKTQKRGAAEEGQKENNPVATNSSKGKRIDRNHINIRKPRPTRGDKSGKAKSSIAKASSKGKAKVALTAGAENGSSDANNGSGNVTQNVAEVHGWQQQAPVPSKTIKNEKSTVRSSRASRASIRASKT